MRESDNTIEELKLPTYGGQAVIEGVMMRGKQSVAIAMRNPENEIVIHKEPLGSIYKSRLVNIPFLRGLVMLWDALILGMRALTISANTQTGEDEQLEGPLLYLTLGISLTIGIVFFFLAPATIGQFVEKTLGWSSWWGNIVEGIIRLAILVGYIWLVGKYSEPHVRKGSCSPLRYKGMTVGAVLRTRSHVLPVFVSPGHLVDIDTSVQVVLGCTGKYRIPEPLRRADMFSKKLKENISFCRGKDERGCCQIQNIREKNTDPSNSPLTGEGKTQQVR